MEVFILKLVIVYSTCFGLLYLSPCIFNLSCPILIWIAQPGLRPGLPLIACERNWVGGGGGGRDPVPNVLEFIGQFLGLYSLSFIPSVHSSLGF